MNFHNISSETISLQISHSGTLTDAKSSTNRASDVNVPFFESLIRWLLANNLTKRKQSFKIGNCSNAAVTSLTIFHINQT